MIAATLRTLRGNRFLRFLVAGAVNTLFGFLVYSAAILFGAAVWLALLCGLVCGTVFNFLTTGGYAFRDLGLGRVPRFVLCYLLIYLLNLRLIEWLSLWVGNPILAQGILTPPVAVLAYVLMARFVFLQKPAPPILSGGHQKSPADAMRRELVHSWLLLIGAQLLVCGVLFFDFMTGQKAFAFYDIGSDTITDRTPVAMHLAGYLKTEGLPGWSFGMGLGANLLFNATDPFLLLTAIAGPEHVLGLRIWAHLLKILLGGGLFFMFLLNCRMRPAIAAVGALAYSFCGYLLIDGQWDPLSTEFVAYALLLWACQRTCMNANIFILPLAIALIVCSGVFVLSVGIFLACVFAAMLVCASEVAPVAKLWMTRVWPLAFIGLLAAGPMLVPSSIEVLDSGRVAAPDAAFAARAAEMFRLNDVNAVYSQIAGLFHKDLLGIGSNHQGWWNYLESPGFYVGVLPLLLLTQLWGGDRLQRRSVAAGLLLIACYFAFPALRSAVYGFQLPYFRTSTLWISILLLVLFARSLELILEKGLDWRILGATTAGVVMLLAASIAHFSGRIQGDHVLKLGCLGAAGIALLLGWQRRLLTNRGFLTAVMIFIGVESAVIGYPSLHDRKIVDRTFTGYADRTIAALDFLRSQDNGFYRVEKTRDSVSLNDALAQGYMGVKSYARLQGSGIVRFYIDLGLLPATHSVINYTNWLPGFGNRFALDSLVGVKYVISYEPLDWPGLTPIYTRYGVRIFRNEYALPLGVVYEQQILRQRFLAYPNALKDFIMLNAVVVDQPIAAMSLFDPGKLAVPGGAWLRDHYVEPVLKLRERGLQLEQFGHNNIRGSVETNVNGVLVFSIPFAPGWSVHVDGAEAPVFRANLGMLAVAMPKGRHVVELRHSQPGIGFGWALTALAILLCACMWRVQASKTRPVRTVDP